MFKRKKVWLFVLLSALIWLNNTSVFISPPKDKPLLLAHRGVHQTFRTEGLDARTNTAARIFPPQHPYLENTIASMEAAFTAGADIVELDIRLTTDGGLAVFHDDVLDYRTNGKGRTEQHTLRELQSLDIGYGYTADSGKTFPFRGKGVGLMPSIEQVLAHFPQRAFLIHLKNDEADVGEALAAYLAKLPPERLSLLAVYGGDRPVAVVKQRMPHVRGSSKATTKRALLHYLLVGWTGYVPPSLRNTQLLLPQKYARWLWGWPHLFLKRTKAADTRLFLVRGKGKYSEGFDDTEDLRELPDNYSGGIWTNRVEKIAPLF